MKLTVLTKDFETLKAIKVKVNRALWYAQCPKCRKSHYSASERVLLPTLIFCDHKEK